MCKVSINQSVDRSIRAANYGEVNENPSIAKPDVLVKEATKLECVWVYGYVCVCVWVWVNVGLYWQDKLNELSKQAKANNSATKAKRQKSA